MVKMLSKVIHSRIIEIRIIDSIHGIYSIGLEINNYENALIVWTKKNRLILDKM